MNATLEYNCEAVKPSEQPAQLGEVEKFSEISSVSMEPFCDAVADYSVRSLRKRFQFGIPDTLETPRPPTAVIEKLPVCKCRDHTDEMSEEKPSDQQLYNSPSVLELRKQYEAKVQSLNRPSSVGSSGGGSQYSRPVTSRTEERQDTFSVDLPHPEGQMRMYPDVPMRAKPSTRWNVANTSVVEIPNGMQITFTVMNDSNH
uniref:Uncharacterized protein n=1 Tax=Anopheles dirus TaxID=7168 RepID=A0A182N4I7_9DIPT